MSTTISRSIPVPIPCANDTITYKEIIRNLTANAPQPYGAIPPLMKKKKPKTKKKRPQPPVRRMSHVENWVAVDSKESIPDEDELIHSPFENFLSMDFLTGILPLHMPPPSLSDPTTLLQQQEIANFTHHHRRRQKGSGNSLDNEDPFTMDEYDEDDDEEDDEDSTVDFSPPSSLSPPTDEKHTSWTVSSTTTDDNPLHKDRPTIYSFTKSHTPSTSTTTSYVLSSSPPDQDRNKWIHTLAKLRQSIVVSQPTITSPSVSSSRDFIPMPPPPRRKRSRRRSEATTQPRFNFDTKTYTRDTRSNPDHLRMIAAELNMMRARKLFSPLKPRGFLPRRKDPFICGDGRPQSPLIMEIAIDT